MRRNKVKKQISKNIEKDMKQDRGEWGSHRKEKRATN